MDNMTSLRIYLAAVPPGPISDKATLEPLLAAAWDEFGGDDGGMAEYKLLRRMETVIWGRPS